MEEVKMTEMKEITYLQALNEALREEMERDDHVFILGEDVAELEGIYKVTEGLLKEFGPERVRDTPISENAIIGAAVGASLLGYRPVAEIMGMDFLNECADQLVNHLPKMRFMSGGKLKIPVTVRSHYGTGGNLGAQHTQFFPAFYMNVPGLNIALPSTPYDAKGLLKTSIRGDTPTLFLETPDFYKSKGLVPIDDYTLPFGKARIVREGEDIAIVALSLTIPMAISAAEKLEKTGISVMIIDPRTLSPLDKKSINDAVKKTGRIIISSADCKTGGVGAEISAIIAEEAVDYLDAPVLRIATPDFPSPFSKPLLEKYMPTEEKIINAVNQIMG
jgi:pyruvate dehydrogenase E1 component beta subunit